LSDIALSEAERASIERDQSGSTFELTKWKKQFNREDLSGLHLEDSGLLVRDIMTPTAYTIPETLPVPQIAKTMIGGRVHRLLVTRGQRLIGIVTPFDMLKLLLQDE
jgi:CBS domain-containing protein